MKTIFSLTMALCLLLISFPPLMAEDETLKESYLEKFYFGALYAGSMTKDYYNFQHDIFPRVGVQTKFSLASGYLRSRVFYDFQKANASLWWIKKISSIELNVGYFPRPVAFINRPNPVSNAGNFEPPCKSVIPGPAFGVLGRINLDKIDSDLMVGLYQTRKNAVELNFGIQQNLNWSVFRKVGISGYHSSRKNGNGKYTSGIVLNSELKRLSLMFFSGRDADSKTYSGFAHFNTSENTAIFTCIVHRDEKWEKIEVGAYKLLSEKILGTEVEYLLGIGYNYSEIKPDSINFYLQVWLDK